MARRFFRREKRESFVRRHRRKSLLALLLLFLRRREGIVTLLVVGLLVLFLFLLPTNLGGSIASWLSDKPGLSWVAKVRKMILASRKPSAAPIIRPGVVPEEDSFNERLYAQLSGGYRGNVSPEEFIRGGKDIAAMHAGPTEILKGGFKASPTTAVISPEEAGNIPNIVQVALENISPGENVTADLGSVGMAYGGKNLFYGPVKGVGKTESAKDSLTGTAPVGPNAASVKMRRRVRRPGRMSRFFWKGKAGLYDAFGQGLVANQSYRYRLANAYHQTDYSVEAEPSETAAVYNRAWATGERAEDKIVGESGASIPPAANPNLPDIDAPSLPTNMEECIEVTNEANGELSRITRDMDKKSDELCGPKAGTERESCDGGLAAQMKALGEELKHPPSCSDCIKSLKFFRCFKKYNGKIRAMNALKRKYNTKIDEQTDLCEQQNVQFRRMNEACGGGMEESDCDKARQMRIAPQSDIKTVSESSCLLLVLLAILTGGLILVIVGLPLIVLLIALPIITIILAWFFAKLAEWFVI